MPEASTIYLTTLLDQLDKGFSMDGLEELCFVLGVDIDNLAGTNKRGKMRSLLMQYAREGRLQLVVDAARDNLPNRDWHDVPASFEVEFRRSEVSRLDGEQPEKPKPRKPFEPELVEVEKDTFMMGVGTLGGAEPSHDERYEIELPRFQISINPITNAEYSHYLKQTKSTAPSELGWDDLTRPSPDQDVQPLSGVTWYEAIEYCRWLSAGTGREYSLPSEAEWERAARLEGDPLGLQSGIREWTTTLWGEKSRQPDERFLPPWRADDNRDDLQANSQIRRVTRGGPESLSTRDSELPGDRGFEDERIGFRVVCRD